LENALLHVIAATLSLLLLAGLFDNGLDATDQESTAPTGNREPNNKTA
jgi:hypothetical protein